MRSSTADIPHSISAKANQTTAVVHGLPTPALVVEASVVRRNIERMAGYARKNGLALRPHTKTHKSILLAKMQLQAGAVGLTIAKVGEAEKMAEVGDDLLMAYPAVDSSRCRRIAELARTKTIRVAVDSSAAVDAVAAAAREIGVTVGLLVEIDVGMQRTGVGTSEKALGLAQLIDRASNVRLDGLMCYPGHIWELAAEQGHPLSAVNTRIEETLTLWRAHGLQARIISGGSTPTALQSHLVPAYTEIRPGTYVFNDMNTVRGGYCTLDDCAARLICTVVSDAVSGQVVLDGGTKTFTSDLCLPARESGHGYVIEYPEAKITRLSEEHAQVDISGCQRRPKVGERVTIVPNHICPCVNLQDSFWWLEEDDSVAKSNVDARGRLS